MVTHYGADYIDVHSATVSTMTLLLCTRDDYDVVIVGEVLVLLQAVNVFYEKAFTFGYF